MSFFNLTMLGYQNQVNGYKHKPECKNDSEQDSSAKKRQHVSFSRFKDAKIKHERSAQEPFQEFCRPVATSQEISWWQKDAQEHLPWARTERHVFAKSEMTA
jgi:hypothetical protein